MTTEETIGTVNVLSYKDWVFEVSLESDQSFLRVCFRDDQGVVQLGRKWRLSRWMTRSEIVQTALKAVLAAEEHEARERFTYKGRAVFGPHLDVEALVEVVDAKAVDVRDAPPTPGV